MTDKAMDSRIRRLAEKENLNTMCRTTPRYSEWDKDRYWWFSDHRHHLVSHERGLNDHEAIEWLTP